MLVSTYIKVAKHILFQAYCAMAFLSSLRRYCLIFACDVVLSILKLLHMLFIFCFRSRVFVFDKLFSRLLSFFFLFRFFSAFLFLLLFEDFDAEFLLIFLPIVRNFGFNKILATAHQDWLHPTEMHLGTFTFTQLADWYNDISRDCVLS